MWLLVGSQFEIYMNNFQYCSWMANRPRDNAGNHYSANSITPICCGFVVQQVVQQIHSTTNRSNRVWAYGLLASYTEHPAGLVFC